MNPLISIASDLFNDEENSIPIQQSGFPGLKYASWNPIFKKKNKIIIIIIKNAQTIFF